MSKYREKAIIRAVQEAVDTVPEGGRCFVACSGGLDSTLLLAVFENLGVLAHVVHINHGLRGKESDKDETFVQELALRSYSPFLSKKIQWPRGVKPSQEKARCYREAYYGTILGENDRLFLAHHLDDQAETILLRLMRGTGIKGLRGILPKSGKKLRPFLDFSKDELRALAESWQLNWREDSSNQSTKYDRNWVRLKLLPLLERKRGGISRHLAQLALEAREVRIPKLKVEPFPFEGGFFYKKSELSRCSSAQLRKLFFISAQQSLVLRSHLKTGSGRMQLEGKREWLVSAGIVWCGLSLPAGETEEDPKSFSSPLGSWRVKEGTLVSRTKISGGDSIKKLFQEKRVPLFFRDWLPFHRQDQNKKPILQMPQKASALAEWWISG